MDLGNWGRKVEHLKTEKARVVRDIILAFVIMGIGHLLWLWAKPQMSSGLVELSIQLVSWAFPILDITSILEEWEMPVSELLLAIGMHALVILGLVIWHHHSSSPFVGLLVVASGCLVLVIDIFVVIPWLIERFRQCSRRR